MNKNLIFEIAKNVESSSVLPLSTVKNENWVKQFDEELSDFFVKKGPEYENI